MDTRPAWTTAIARALGLVLPAPCVGCAAPDVSWCIGCATWLAAQPMKRWMLPGGRALTARAPFAGPLRSAIINVKDNGRRDGIEALGLGLAEAVWDLPGTQHGEWLLVPAPSRWWANRRRDGDILSLVAQAACNQATEHARWSVRAGLHMPWWVRDQSALSRSGRLANIARRIQLSDSANYQRARVVVVDDVVTSGATLTECVAAVETSSPRALHCAVIGWAE